MMSVSVTVFARSLYSIFIHILEVSCQGSTIEVKSGPTAITCKLNDTVFSYLNITSRSSVSNITVIAQIDNTGVSTDLIPTDDITATLNDEIVTISIRSPTCTTGDFYGVDFIVSDIIVGSSEGKLVVRSMYKVILFTYRS